MEKKFKALPPVMPNFVRFETGLTGKKQDGFKLDEGAIEVLHSVEYTLRNAGNSKEADKVLDKIISLVERL